MTNTGHLSALQKHPEMAQQIALLISHYANLEYHMFLVYAAISTAHIPNVTKGDVADCFSKFYKLRSVNNKTGLMLDAARPLFDPLRYQALVRLSRRFKGAASRRTDVSHCVFMAKDDGPIWRLSTARPEPSFQRLEPGYFDRTSHQFRTLGRDISTFLTLLVMTDERCMNLLRALPLPPGDPFPQGAEAPPGPQDQRAKDELKASVSRLGLLPLYRED